MAKRIDQITTVAAAAGDKFVIYDASTNDVGAVAVDGYLMGRFPTWTLASAYASGETVRYNGGLWSASGAVAANTSFTVGSGVNQWTPLSTGLWNSNTNRQVFSTNTTDTVVSSPNAAKSYLNITDTVLQVYTDNKYRIGADTSGTFAYGPTGTNAGSYRYQLSDTAFNLYRPAGSNGILESTATATRLRGPTGTDAGSIRVVLDDASFDVFRAGATNPSIDVANTGITFRGPTATDAGSSKVTIADASTEIMVKNTSRFKADATNTTVGSPTAANSIMTIADGSFTFKVGSGSSGLYLDTVNHRPSIDNNVNLGATSFRYGTLYAVNATVNTSDQREKTPIKELPVELLDAWLSDVRIGEWNWLEKDNGTHAGFIAQDIIAVFEKAGIDWTKWFTVQQAEDGKYSIVMPEVLAIEAAAQRRRLDKLEAKLNANKD